MTRTGFGNDKSLFCLCLLECLLVLSAFLLIPQLQLPSSDSAALAGGSLPGGLRGFSLERLGPAAAAMLVIRLGRAGKQGCPERARMPSSL